MKKKWWSLSLFELLTTIISVLGFAAVIWTIESGKKALTTNSYLQVYGWTYDIDKIFIEKPQLRHYFYEGDSILPNDSNYQQVEAIAEFMLDNFDAVLNNEDYFKKDLEAKKAWVNYIRCSFHSSPILRTEFKNNLSSYRKELEDVYEYKDQ
jgi:hypothetical protein